VWSAICGDEVLSCTLEQTWVWETEVSVDSFGSISADLDKHEEETIRYETVDADR